MNVLSSTFSFKSENVKFTRSFGFLVLNTKEKWPELNQSSESGRPTLTQFAIKPLYVHILYIIYYIIYITY